jgi:hypothetical protein
MSTAFVLGKMQEYVSNIEFSLNFEDKKSVKVKKGEIVLYDGTIAKYVKQPSGEEISGKTTSLRSAVASNWLTLNVPGATTGPINVNLGKPVQGGEGVVYKAPDYSALKGGAFDEYLKKDSDTVIAGSRVIKEQDQVVKATNFNAPTATKTASVKGKMEVAGDQVPVKEVTTVSSSTSTATQRTQKTVIVQADDGHADHVIVGKKKTVEAAPVSKAKSFTVDSFTPSLPEGATLAEVKNATASFDGTQDGREVKKIGEKKMIMPEEPTEVEGIVLKKTDFSGKQSSGSTPIADLSGVKTQSEVNEIENEIEKKSQVQAPAVEKKNYVDMLPDDWSTLHWVKKEKFIMEITDPEFLKFIMKVESVKAVHAACRKRMVELGKQKNANG